MNLSEQFNEFINYLTAEKDVSKHTKANYSSDFKTFLLFLENNSIQPDLQTITTPILRSYFAYLKNNKKYQNKTMRRKIHSLSSFYKFCLEQEYIIKNPMAPIHAPKQEQKIPKFIKKDEVETLIEMAWKFGDENRLRDKCFIEFLAFTGVRRQELLALNFSDIDFNTGQVKIRMGKGKKERMIPLNKQLQADLWAYLQTRLPLYNMDAPVFISNTGARLTHSPAQMLFKKYLISFIDFF